MLKFNCKDTFYNLPEEAAERVIYQSDRCEFCCMAENKRDLIKLIVEHATEVHGLEDRRLVGMLCACFMIETKNRKGRKHQ